MIPLSYMIVASAHAVAGTAAGAAAALALLLFTAFNVELIKYHWKLFWAAGSASASVLPARI